MAIDENGDEPRMAFWAQVAGKVRYHAMEQLMNIGRLDDGLIRGLTKVGARLIELFSFGTVVEPVNSCAVGSLLGCVTEQTQDELFDL